VAFRIAPLTDRDVDELLRSIRCFPLLQGYHGQPPADLDALRETLLRVSRLSESVPEILELDLNPVIALSSGQGCRIVDARIRVGSAQRGHVSMHPSRADADRAAPDRRLAPTLGP
jgi:acyl-CoA synthetase (NDP forming)